MTTANLKTEITKAINGINDKSLLEALYTIIHNAGKKPSNYELSNEDWAIIESRKKEVKTTKSKTVTMEQIHKQVTNRLA